MTCIIGTAAVIWWSIIPTHDHSYTPKESETPYTNGLRGTNTTPSPSNSVPISQLLEVVNIRLQRPLYDPPPQVVVEKLFVPPPIRHKLVGTIIGSNTPQAMITDPRGQVRIVGEGESLDEIKVITIHDNYVTIEYHDETRTLKSTHHHNTP